METFSALLALYAGNSLVTGEFPFQRPVTRSFDVFFDLSLNKCLSKQSRRRWYETPSRSLWHHCNETSDKLIFKPVLAQSTDTHTVYPKKYAHGFVVLCFVVVMQSFIMNSHEVFIHIHQGCFAGTGAIVRLPQCQWSKPDGYGKISQCITTTKHSKAKTVCIFLGIYCICDTYMCGIVIMAYTVVTIVVYADLSWSCMTRKLKWLWMHQVHGYNFRIFLLMLRAQVS